MTYTVRYDSKQGVMWATNSEILCRFLLKIVETKVNLFVNNAHQFGLVEFVCTNWLSLVLSMWCYNSVRWRQSPPWRLNPDYKEPLHWISLRTVGHLRSYIKHSIISVSCSLQILGRQFKTLSCATIFQSTSWCLNIRWNTPPLQQLS